MSKQRLYLFVGYPGAGKTTVAKIIAKNSNALHLWADVERHKLFEEPTHSQEESNELYDRLNAATDYVLEQGKSVVFDTNFNHLKDRDKLREIANKHNSETIIIWITTPVDIAKDRAVRGHQSRNLYEMNMSEEQFDSIVAKLEPPTKKENVIKIDGTKPFNEKAILKSLDIKS
jgi:hypothetical protein